MGCISHARLFLGNVYPQFVVFYDDGECWESPIGLFLTHSLLPYFFRMSSEREVNTSCGVISLLMSISLMDESALPNSVDTSLISLILSKSSSTSGSTDPTRPALI